jgi:hypothetical protein
MKTFILVLLFCASALAQASITLPAAGGIPSRTIGIAPLAVVFDISTTTSTATTRPYHDLECRWNFGDAQAKATWSYGALTGLSKNEGRGLTAAHIYETAGTYAWSVSCYDGSVAKWTSGSITVSSADGQFTTTKTVCITNGSDFTGCPAGATQASSVSNFKTAIDTYGANNKRLLFKAGDTFTCTAATSWNYTGPSIIGSYGSGAMPKVTIGANACLLLGANGGQKTGDLRVMDLEMDGQSNAAAIPIGAEGGFDQFTALRLNIHNAGQAIYFDWNNIATASGQHIYREIAIVDSVFSHMSGPSLNAFYISAEKFAFLGNSAGNTDGAQHVMRAGYLVSGVITNNSMFDPLGGGSPKHIIKLHAPDFAGTAAVPASTYTEFVVITDNKFTNALSQTSLDIGPQNNASNERVRNVVAERNWLLSSMPQVSCSPIVLAASEVTVRNNIIDGTGCDGFYGISVTAQGNTVIAAPANNGVFNNTIYLGSTPSGTGVCPCTQTGVQIVNAGLQPTGTLVKNNLAYIPNASASYAFISNAGALTTISGNTCDTDACTTLVKNSPTFASASPTTAVDFKLQTSSYGKNAGGTVANYADFGRRIWPTATGFWDIGAWSTNVKTRGVACPTGGC